MRKHKSNFPLVNNFYELQDTFAKLPVYDRIFNHRGQHEILKNYDVTIGNFNKTKKYLYELNQFDFIIFAEVIYCKKNNWFDILLALKEKLSRASFGNIKVCFQSLTVFTGYTFSSKELMKLISLRNHENFDNILILAENGQMDIINSLTL